jgi:hypothetical protein
MAGIRKEVIRETYAVPDDFEPMAALAMGYLGDPDRLPDKLARQERAERSRRPLTDTIFRDGWGDTADLVEE